MIADKMAALEWIHGLFRLSQKGSAEEVYQNLLEHIARELGLECGMLALQSEMDGQARVVAAKTCPRYQAGNSFSGKMAVVAPLGKEGGGEADAWCCKGAADDSATLCRLLMVGNQAIGRICGHRAGGKEFSDEQLRYGGLLVAVAGVVVENLAMQRGREEQIIALSGLNEKLRQAHNQLLQSEKMASVGQLAAGVAHEINNPLGYVFANLETLQKYLLDFFAVLEAYEKAEPMLAGQGGTLEEIRKLKAAVDLDFLRKDVRDLLFQSLNGISRVEKIILDLKDFSRASTEEAWQWSDLHRGLDSTLNIVWNELKYKAEVKKEYGTLPLVYCLPMQLNQVFMNILVNAAQAIEKRGTITLRTGMEGDQVWVEVKDTGVGIAPENLGRVFEPFFTTKPPGKGTGLGLSVSFSIVEKHRGRIEVKSKVGKGSVFRVWLPVGQPGAGA